MSSTHLALHYHIVFSTKGRRRMIADPWRAELHAYLGGILSDMEVIPEAINGPGDHVHILAGLKATHMLSEVLRQVKRGSSLWIHQHGISRFEWQEGYGAFTVSPSHLNAVKRYIANQGRASQEEDIRRGVCRLVAIEWCGI